ncbi:MFS transporter [Carnobacteriaceae bacterium zg-ZUI240]|nr:MFS transporter [Carnobacteriaceae bacterium zg-ZUI240]
MEHKKESYISYVVMYLAYFASYALFTVLTPVYLTDKGYSTVDVSFVVSSGLLASMLLSTYVGRLSDKYGTKHINIVLLLISASFGILYMLMDQLILIALAYAATFCLMNVVNPAIEKVATMSRFRYGTIRVWGTIGFSLGTQVSGIIYGNFGAIALYSTFSIVMVITAMSLLFIPGVHGMQTTNVSDPSIHKSEYRLMALLSQRNFMVYLLIGSLLYASANVSATHLPNMFKLDGLDVSQISTILSIAVLAEIPLMLYSHTFMDKLDSKQLMFLYLSAFGIQFAVYAYVPFVPLKIMVTLLCKHVMGMLFIMTNLKVIHMIIPLHSQMTALAIVSTLNSVSAVILQNISGAILSVSSYTFFYTLLGVLCGASLLLLPLLKINEDKSVKLFN